MPRCNLIPIRDFRDIQTYLEALSDRNYSDCFAEMEIDMLVSTLLIKFMALVFITLQMAIVTRDHGMKAESKVMACIPSEMVTPDVGNGIVAILRLPHLH